MICWSIHARAVISPLLSQLSLIPSVEWKRELLGDIIVTVCLYIADNIEQPGSHSKPVGLPSKSPAALVLSLHQLVDVSKWLSIRSALQLHKNKKETSIVPLSLIWTGGRHVRVIVFIICKPYQILLVFNTCHYTHYFYLQIIVLMLVQTEYFLALKNALFLSVKVADVKTSHAQNDQFSKTNILERHSETFAAKFKYAF